MFHSCRRPHTSLLIPTNFNYIPALAGASPLQNPKESGLLTSELSLVLNSTALSSKSKAQDPQQSYLCTTRARASTGSPLSSRSRRTRSAFLAGPCRTVNIYKGEERNKKGLGSTFTAEMTSQHSAGSQLTQHAQACTFPCS